MSRALIGAPQQSQTVTGRETLPQSLCLSSNGAPLPSSSHRSPQRIISTMTG